MLDNHRRPISQDEKDNIGNSFINSGMSNYSDFAKKHHEKIGRTEAAVRNILTSHFATKPTPTIRKFKSEGKNKKVVESTTVNNVAEQLELQMVEQDEVTVVQKDEVAVVKKDIDNDIMSLKGKITVSINSGIFTTQIVSKNVNISKNQIVIEL